MGKSKEYLIFVDTNVFLDFYRASTEAQLSLLKRLVSLSGRIISSCQVEMEFTKNRRKVIQNAFSSLNAIKQISLPIFISQYQAGKSVLRSIGEAKTKVNDLRSRLKKILTNANERDTVYTLLRKMFRDRDNLILKSDDPKTYEPIHQAAWQRFVLAYPPRKNEGLSIGDAINWEWIIACAKQHNVDVVIVSRDSDYGIRIDGQSFINDWLLEEFKRRVTRRRNVVLVERLSQGLEMLSVKVTKTEEKEESELISLSQKRPVTLASAMAALAFMESRKYEQEKLSQRAREALNIQQAEFTRTIQEALLRGSTGGVSSEPEGTGS